MLGMKAFDIVSKGESFVVADNLLLSYAGCSPFPPLVDASSQPLNCWPQSLELAKEITGFQQ